MLSNRFFSSVVMIVFVSLELPNVLLSQSFRDYEKNIVLLRANVPKSRINLDELPGEIRYPSLVIGGEDPNAATPGSLFLVNPISAIVLRDSIFICDRKLNAIIVSTMDGRLVRKIGRSGKAPGEFLNPAGIATNGEVVGVYDTQNARVQLFDVQYKYLGSLPASFPVFVTTLAFTSNSLLTHSDYGDTLLLRARSLEKPFSLKQSFLPLIVPQRHEASGLNQVMFAANRRGWVCAGYEAFPYLFVFDSLGNHVHTLAFEGKAIDDLGKKNAPGVVSTVGGIPFWRIISSLWLENDNTILMGRGSDLYVFNLTKQGYALQRRINLRHKNKRPDGEDKIHIWSIFHAKKRIYVTDTVVLSNPWVLVYDL